MLHGLGVAQAAVTGWPENLCIFSLKKKYIFFLHISSSYAKILGETNFPPLEFLRTGSKAKDGESKRERLNYGNNNGQLHIANATSDGARKAAWANV